MGRCINKKTEGARQEDPRASNKPTLERRLRKMRHGNMERDVREHLREISRTRVAHHRPAPLQDRFRNLFFLDSQALLLANHPGWVHGSRFRVQGLEFRIKDFGFELEG